MDVPLFAGSPDAKLGRKLAQGVPTEESPAHVSVRYNPNTKSDVYASSMSLHEARSPSSQSRERRGEPIAPDRQLKFTTHEFSDGELSPQQPPVVILVDALKQSRDPKHREIDVDVSHEQSPIKVVRHIQNAANSELRNNTGSTGQAAQVYVDLVPNISLTARAPENVSNCPRNLGKAAAHETKREVERHKPTVVKESGRVLNARQPMPKQQVAHQIMRGAPASGSGARVRQSKPDSGLQPQTAEAGRDDDTGPVTLGELGVSSGAVTSSAMKQFVGPTEVLGRPKAVTAASDRAANTAKATAKKQPKVVSSRYLQEAASARQRLGTPTLPSNKTLDLTRADPGERSAIAAARGASTPNHDQSRLPIDSLDASAILATNVTTLRHDTHDSCALGKNTAGATGNAKRKITQQCLDVLYSRYLQWVYIEHKAKKSFREQEASAMSQLYALWELNRQQRSQLAELEAECAHLQHINKVDELLELQGHALEHVVADLPKLSDQYGRMAAALERTRHELPVRGIYMPDGGGDTALSAYHDALLVAARESEQLLGEITALTRRDGAATKLTQLASTMRELVRHSEAEVKELNGCQESVAALKSLTMKEASLNMQQIELSREPVARFG